MAVYWCCILYPRSSTSSCKVQLLLFLKISPLNPVSRPSSRFRWLHLKLTEWNPGASYRKWVCPVALTVLIELLARMCCWCVDGDGNVSCPVAVRLFSNFEANWKHHQHYYHLCHQNHFYDSNGTIIKTQYKMKWKERILNEIMQDIFPSEWSHLLDYLPSDGDSRVLLFRESFVLFLR